MTRTHMIDLVIQRFGFENKETINFIKKAEEWYVADLEALFKEVIVKPIEAEEDDL